MSHFYSLDLRRNKTNKINRITFSSCHTSYSVLEHDNLVKILKCEEDFDIRRTDFCPDASVALSEGYPTGFVTLNLKLNSDLSIIK